MGVGWDARHDDDDLIPVEPPLAFRGAAFGLLVTAIWGIVFGAAMWFMVNGFQF